jgi:host factor-I protein
MCRIRCMSFAKQDVRSSRSPAPPEQTSHEAKHLKALGEKQTPVTIKLRDGELVEGWIEYYDRDMLRLTRDHQPNLFIFKHGIVYIAHSE